MKYLRSSAFVLLLLALISADAKPARPLLEPDERMTSPWYLVGTYALYRDTATPGTPIAHMKITGQYGNEFSIGIATPTGQGALDWTSRGIIHGNYGHYDWEFGDGKTGRTTFVVDTAGYLRGKVRGSGIDWDYLAKRVEEVTR